MTLGKVTFGVLSALLMVAARGHAAPFVVNAVDGSALPTSTISLVAGQSYTVTAGINDLWSLGSLPRWCNADGLTGNRFATGTDESGQPAGTLIGQNFGTVTSNGLTAPFGVLAGTINGGTPFVVGTNFSGVAATSGTLQLFCLDSGSGDNTQFITANVNVTTAVPEASGLSLLPLGLLAIVGAAKRRGRIAA